MEELIEKRYQILQRTSQQREKIGGRRLPRIREPRRECTHWDYFLEEMKWLANDYIEDRKHKQALAFVLVTEISRQKSAIEKKEARKESASRDTAKKLSDLVMKYFYHLDGGKRSKVPQKSNEKMWKVTDISTSPSITIVLENSHNKLNTKIDDSKPVYRYSVGILHNFGYSYTDKSEDLLNQEPSTPETTGHGDDLDGYESISNFQLFYDADSGEKDLNLQLEELHLEDLDVYRPLTTDNIDFRDITYEETLIEEELFELVPDSEEYMLLESTKKVLESRETEVFSSNETNFVCKRDWKIFEDLILEQTVCEFGGNWEFVSDLLSMHHLTTFNYVTPEECFNRWGLLQKRKGRVVSSNFRPAQVFQNEYPPVQFIPSNFSLFKKRMSNVYIFPRLIPAVPIDNCATSFEFYLSHNVRPECNSYFTNYKSINNKFYTENSGTVLPSKGRSKEVRNRDQAQQFIDKEEENLFSVFELIDNNKPETVHRGAVSNLNLTRRPK